MFSDGILHKLNIFGPYFYDSCSYELFQRVMERNHDQIYLHKDIDALSVSGLIFITNARLAI